MSTINADPFDLDFDVASSALVFIDFQRDFVLPGGFGEELGNDTSLLLKAIPPAKDVLAKAREVGMHVLHTREGHRPDLSDCPPAKLTRGGNTFIGTDGPMGRILVRGSKGHDIVEDVYPIDGEPIIDKLGKGAFYQTDLHQILFDWGIKTLFFGGVTTEVCVQTSMREANDRGFECLLLTDCTGATDKSNHEAAIKMVQMQGGVFGATAPSINVIRALEPLVEAAP